MTARRTERDMDADFDDEDHISIWRRIFGNRPLETLAAFFVLVAIATVAANALYGQSRAHPAPLFATAKPVAVLADTTLITGSVPRRADPVPAEAPRSVAATPDASKPSAVRAALVFDIQRELQRRGYYAGTVDGLDGPRTDAAIRDAEQALGQRLTGEPTEALLAALSRLPARATPAALPAKDPIAALIEPQARVIAVQRALSDYGYGSIRPSGIVGPETRAAIEKFERDRRLPVTGQIGPQLVRELSAITGRPLD
jgi:peptidoglycan hydrolase-like protein with peptidoglycan-binding domain